MAYCMASLLHSSDEASAIKRDEITTACTTRLQTRIWLVFFVSAFAYEIARIRHLKGGGGGVKKEMPNSRRIIKLTSEDGREWRNFVLRFQIYSLTDK
jgi:hypothetical protein